MNGTPTPGSIAEPCGQNPAPSGSEGRFKAFIDGCPSMIWEVGPDAHIRFFNKACREFSGIRKAELHACEWQSLIHPADAPEFVAKCLKAISERAPFSAEARFLRADREWRMLGSRAQPSFSPGGAYQGHIGLSADITERIKVEQDRQFELSLVRSIHEETIEGILVVDDQGKVVSHNRRLREIWQIPEQDAARLTSTDVEAAPNLPLLLTAAERVESPHAFITRVQELYSHPDQTDHCEVKLKDGRTLERHSTGLRNPDGNYMGRVTFYRDITAQKQAEANLQDARDRADEANRRLQVDRALIEGERKMLHALIDNIPDFMYVKDLESRFVVANPHLAQVVGVESPEQLLGKTDFDFYPPEMANGFYEDEQSVIRSGQPLRNREEKGIDMEGNEVDILTTKVPIRNSEGEIIGIAGVGRDITDRKKMENALREAERNYRGIFDNAIVGMFQSSPEGRLHSVNPALAFMFGYDSPEAMIEQASDIFQQCYAEPKRREEFVFLMQTLGGVHNFDGEALCSDGSRIWISMSVRAIRQSGVVVRFEGMCEDITERNQLREQLFQAQKLESVGQLAAGIAHEINTPTQYIGDNVRFMKDAFSDLKGLLSTYDRLLLAAKGNTLSSELIQETEEAAKRSDAAYLLEEIPKAIDQSLDGIGRVSTIVGAMKEFSHPSTKEQVPLDLNHAIESTITVARNEWKYVADLETDFDASLPPVPCQPGEFNQVILNLIVNAAHAIGDVVRQGGPDKGKITVQTRRCSEWAEIRIKDTGTGIPEKIRARIFDPFFTTKEVGKGTGQGLAIARSVIVDKHGGSLHFETEDQKGTTFIIRLPIAGRTLGTKAVAA
jgi:PAS domain S-box-containing protein